MPKKPKKFTIPAEKIPATVTALLGTTFWLATVKTEVAHSRLHDDHMGTRAGKLNVMFTPHGDVAVWIDDGSGKPSKILTFRMPGGGGGNSPRTRKALIILAQAMIEDNKADAV